MGPATVKGQERVGSPGLELFKDIQVQAGTLTELGILVTLVRNPKQQFDGLIDVQIPSELAQEGKSLSFPLDLAPAEEPSPDMPLTITMNSDQEMPNWLRYEKASRRLVATRIPKGALPLQLVLKFAGERWMVSLTERASK
jgi:hypothetical protein